MNQPQPRILLVEDDEHIGFILRFLLERNGFAVDQATDGRQALERLRLAPPDLVLMDIMLPYHDGLEVLSQLRRLPAPDSQTQQVLEQLARRVAGKLLHGPTVALKSRAAADYIPAVRLFFDIAADPRGQDPQA